MPFKSKKQIRWAFANHKPWARRWASHTPSIPALPEEAKSDKKEQEKLGLSEGRPMASGTGITMSNFGQKNVFTNMIKKRPAMPEKVVPNMPSTAPGLNMPPSLQPGTTGMRNPGWIFGRQPIPQMAASNPTDAIQESYRAKVSDCNPMAFFSAALGRVEAADSLARVISFANRQDRIAKVAKLDINVIRKLATINNLNSAIGGLAPALKMTGPVGGSPPISGNMFDMIDGGQPTNVYDSVSSGGLQPSAGRYNMLSQSCHVQP